MLTPRFRVWQSAERVWLAVAAPYSRAADADLHAERDTLVFVCAPYFLRLRLPGCVCGGLQGEPGPRGTYDCDTGEYTFELDKETPGEHFPHLDMITSLLAPRDIPDVSPTLVRALHDDGITFDENDNEHGPGDGLITNHGYGFNNKITSDFRDIGSEFPQIFELRIPEKVPQAERHALRIQYETEKFSSDHYLADYFDKELLEPYLAYENPWKDGVDTKFTDDDVSILKELPNKCYLMTKKEYEECLIGLVDILFGYCYDKRSMLNNSNVESSWTINRLSATLSWFCNFSDPEQTLISSYRRALIYPIYRNFELCQRVQSDLVSLLKLGKKFIIKCMIEIHQMFNCSSDARYILNQIYIKDYLVFLQKCNEHDYEELTNKVENVKVIKDFLDLELADLEHAANLVRQEEMGVVENEMALKMASMNLLSGNNESRAPLDDTSDSSSDSSESSSDESSSELDSDDDAP